MTMLEAKHVQLHGNMTVAGMNTRDFSPMRDGCELHLHQETGGVYVQRDGETTYLSSTVIVAVELKDALFLNTSKASVKKPNTTPVVAQAEEDGAAHAQAVEKGAKNLADEVLAELRDGETKKAKHVPKSRQLSLKRS